MSDQSEEQMHAQDDAEVKAKVEDAPVVKQINDPEPELEIEKKYFINFNFETVASIMAMLIGMAALYVAYDQAQILRIQQHAMVRPLVSFDGGFNITDETITTELKLKNAGIGPALVKWVSIDIDGQKYTYNELINFRPEKLSKPDAWTGSQVNFIISPTNEVTLVKAFWPNEGQNENLVAQFWNGNLMRAKVTSCYCSVYDRCWHVEIMDGTPKSVENCTIKN